MNRLRPVAFSRLTGKKRSPASDWQLGLVLAFVAGYINSGGFFIVRHFTSHMTGIISEAADSMAQGDVWLALSLLGYAACFVLGATLTTLMVLTARHACLHAQYSLPLLVEAGLLLVIIGLASFLSDPTHMIPVVIASLSFLMGLQNALITKASTAIVRTTHVTGLATDLGIEFGRLISGRIRSQTTGSRIRALLFGLVILSFLSGGTTGAVLVDHLGAPGLFPMAALLILVSMPPVMKDWRVAFKLHRRRRRI